MLGLKFFPFLMKLGLQWDIQQPFTIVGWGQPSAKAVICSLATVCDICFESSSVLLHLTV
jgi:hypothetical protein